MTTATALLPTGTWAIDPVHSSVGFSVRHLVVSKVRGEFETFSGAITVADDSSNTRNEQRDTHLKTADFFDVQAHPVATFTSTGVRADGDRYVLDGDFTLKGITRPISLDLEFNGVNPGMG